MADTIGQAEIKTSYPERDTEPLELIPINELHEDDLTGIY